MQEKNSRMDRKIGELLKIKREAAGLTQPQLAQKLGISQGTISRIENGLQGNLKYEKLKPIMEYLNIVEFHADDPLQKLILQWTGQLSSDDKTTLLRLIIRLQNRPDSASVVFSKILESLHE